MLSNEMVFRRGELWRQKDSVGQMQGLEEVPLVNFEVRTDASRSQYAGCGVYLVPILHCSSAVNHLQLFSAPEQCFSAAEEFSMRLCGNDQKLRR